MSFLQKQLSRAVLVPAAATTIALLLSGCGSSPRQIDATSDEGLVTMEVDVAGIVQWSESLTNQMLAAGFLDRYDQPVPMVVSDIRNRTDMAGFPKEMVLARIRSRLLSSGKVRLISTYGSDARDEMSRDTRDLRNDPMFDQSQIPPDGIATVARLSLSGEMLYRGARAGRTSQASYEMRLIVTDVATGDVVWEGLSDRIDKQETQGIFGG